MLDGGPLVAGHRAGARIGQEIDQDVVRVEVEEVVPGRPERLVALLDRRQADGLELKPCAGKAKDACNATLPVTFTVSGGTGSVNGTP